MRVGPVGAERPVLAGDDGRHYPRQDSTTVDMVFGVGFLIYHLSQFTVLEPGDVVNTGTPQGVALSGRFPYLAAGDLVEVEVSGLGRLANRIVAATR